MMLIHLLLLYALIGFTFASYNWWRFGMPYGAKGHFPIMALLWLPGSLYTIWVSGRRG